MCIYYYFCYYKLLYIFFIYYSLIFYVFLATSEGSIPMYDGEELYLIEVDQGDGWTRVRRLYDYEEGFVPTSYINCTLYA